MKNILAAFALSAFAFKAGPALALSVDHDSAFANADGSSKFSDPDDALADAQSGILPLGMQAARSAAPSGTVTIIQKSAQPPAFPDDEMNESQPSSK